MGDNDCWAFGSDGFDIVELAMAIAWRKSYEAFHQTGWLWVVSGGNVTGVYGKNPKDTARPHSLLS